MAVNMDDGEIEAAHRSGDENEEEQSKKKEKEVSLIDKVKSTQYFYNEMNKIARDIGMQFTVYHSPHGLNNKQNVSCVYDVSLLMAQASKNPLFVEIMGAKTYTT